ncbi:MAG TPA: MAPEG family protein [Moraxellaceae bacterium]|nr:MAPEG family protein [Moraxellaceae bacterium]
MTVAYWCVLAAILLPYAWTGVAKFTSGFRPRDNHNPREYLDRLEGPAKRAHWAQLNTFESIPGFMAAVIIAHLAQAPQGPVDALALTYIALRVAYGVLYIKDLASLRSLVWAAGLACVVGLFVVAA